MKLVEIIKNKIEKKSINKKIFLMTKEELLKFEYNNENYILDNFSKKEKKLLTNKVFEEISNKKEIDINILSLIIKISGLNIIDKLIINKNNLKYPTISNYRKFLNEIYTEPFEDINKKRDLLKNIVRLIINEKLLSYNIENSKKENSQIDENFEVNEKVDMIYLLLVTGKNIFTNEELFEIFNKINFEKRIAYGESLTEKSKLFWNLGINFKNPEFLTYLIDNDHIDLIIKSPKTNKISPLYPFLVLSYMNMNNKEEYEKIIKKCEESRKKDNVSIIEENKELAIYHIHQIFENPSLNKSNLLNMIEVFQKLYKEVLEENNNKLNLINYIFYYDIKRMSSKKEDKVDFLDDEFFKYIFENKKELIKDFTEKDYNSLFKLWVEKTKDLKIVNEYMKKYNINIENFLNKNIQEIEFKYIEEEYIKKLISSYQDVLGEKIDISKYLKDVSGFKEYSEEYLEKLIFPVVNHYINNKKTISYNFLSHIKKELLTEINKLEPEKINNIINKVSNINLEYKSKIKVLKFLINEKTEYPIKKNLSMLEKEMIRSSLKENQNINNKRRL